MKPGDLVEAKGSRKEYLYPQGWSKAMDEDVAQAEKQSRAAKARGVGLKWSMPRRERPTWRANGSKKNALKASSSARCRQGHFDDPNIKL